MTGTEMESLTGETTSGSEERDHGLETGLELTGTETVLLTLEMAGEDGTTPGELPPLTEFSQLEPGDLKELSLEKSESEDSLMTGDILMDHGEFLNGDMASMDGTPGTDGTDMDGTEPSLTTGPGEMDGEVPGIPQ